MRRASCGTSAMPAKTTTAKTAGAKKTTPKKEAKKAMKAMAKEATDEAKKAMKMAKTPKQTKIAKAKAKSARLRHQLAGVDSFSCSMLVLQLAQESDDILAEEIEALEALRDEVDERMLALKQSRDNYSRILKESGWIGGDLWPEVLRRGYFNGSA